MKGSCYCTGLIERADSGGERAGLICSLFGAAKFNGVNPEAWLRHVLARIADHWQPGRRIPILALRRAGSNGLKHASSLQCDAIISQYHAQLKTAQARRLRQAQHI